MDKPSEQRIYVLVETRSLGTETVMGVMDYETIEGAKWFRHEGKIAEALRELADRIEEGSSFVGNLKVSKKDLKLMRNE